MLQVPFAFLVAVCCAGPPAATESAPYWPRFHGPQGDNVSTDTGLLQEWPEAGPKLLWTAEGIGEGYGTVSLADGGIYVAGDIGESCVVTALDMDGQPRWRYENGAAWQESVPGGRGTPAIDRGRVYHENAHGSVVCLEAKTGNKVWGRNLVEEFAGRYSGWGYGDSVVLDGKHVICCPGGDTAMVALDSASGRTVWKSSSAGEPAGYATPIVVTCGGLRIVLTMSEKGLIGVNADTGQLLWRFEHVNPRYVANSVTPIFRDGRVFISSGYETGSALLKIDVSGETATVEPVWRTKNLDNRMGGVVLLGGFLYGASQTTNKRNWVCLEWETGALKYAEPGVGEGSVTTAEGMLYTLSERGKVGLVSASPSGHEVISQFNLPEGENGPTWAHPVVCGGRLYLRHGSRLYTYDIRAK